MSSENILAILDDILIGGKSVEGVKKAKVQALTLFEIGIITYSQFRRVLRIIEANR